MTNKDSYSKLKVLNKPIDDVFGAFLLDGAEYDTKCGYDIPFINVPNSVILPKK
ncbi:MAG: hypothetical protein ACI4UK_12400 [Floccifex sp.]